MNNNYDGIYLFGEIHWNVMKDNMANFNKHYGIEDNGDYNNNSNNTREIITSTASNRYDGNKCLGNHIGYSRPSGLCNSINSIKNSTSSNSSSK